MIRFRAGQRKESLTSCGTIDVRRPKKARASQSAPRQQRKKKKSDSFFLDVYVVVRKVPAGRVTSYGAVARYLKRESGARIVGWAMNGCPRDVPAHRIVNSAGVLSGKNSFRHPSEMERLLKAEGVRVLDDKVQNFSQIFWDPVKELSSNQGKVSRSSSDSPRRRIR